MTHFSVAVSRSECSAIACSAEGLRFGAVTLIASSLDMTKRRRFFTISPERFTEALFAAYGPDFETDLSYRMANIDAIARALTEGRLTHAMIGAAHLRLPGIGPEGLACLERLAKYSPDQPRVPAGNPDGGQWTRDDSNVPSYRRILVTEGIRRQLELAV